MFFSIVVQCCHVLVLLYKKDMYVVLFFLIAVKHTLENKDVLIIYIYIHYCLYVIE